MVVIVFLPLLVIGVITATVLQRRYGRVAPDRLLRSVALALAVTFSVFAGLFIIGETVDDPGGAAAAALIAAWLVPMGVLGVLAWRWPSLAVWVLTIVVVAIGFATILHAIDPAAWRTFEDQRGPVRAVAVFVVTLPMALGAWRRPLVFGALLLVVGMLPIAVQLLANRPGGLGGATAAVSAPAAIVGALFLVSQWFALREQPGTRSSSGRLK